MSNQPYIGREYKVVKDVSVYGDEFPIGTIVKITDIVNTNEDYPITCKKENGDELQFSLDELQPLNNIRRKNGL